MACPLASLRLTPPVSSVLTALLDNPPAPTTAADASVPLPSLADIDTVLAELDLFDAITLSQLTCLTEDRKQHQAYVAAARGAEGWRAVKERLLASAAIPAAVLGASSSSTSLHQKRKHEDMVSDVVTGGGGGGGGKRSSKNHQSVSRRIDDGVAEVDSVGASPPPPSHAASASHDSHSAAHAKPGVIAIAQFYNSVEPYLRAMTANDLLEPLQSANTAANTATNPDAAYFHIPPLGPHFSHIWALEDDRPIPPHNRLNPTDDTTTTIRTAKDMIDAQTLDSSRTRALPFTARLVSLLLPDPTIATNPDLRLIESWDTHVKGPTPMLDYQLLEDRIKKECRIAGILTPPPESLDPATGAININWSVQEDDEVCARLRDLQRRLAAQITSTRVWKENVLAVAERHLEWQDYQAVLDDLEKNVLDSYIRRKTKAAKSKKKGTAGTGGEEVQYQTGNARVAVERMRKYVAALGGTMAREEYRWPPMASILAKPEQEEQRQV